MAPRLLSFFDTRRFDILDTLRGVPAVSLRARRSWLGHGFTWGILICTRLWVGPILVVIIVIIAISVPAQSIQDTRILPTHEQ